jgi:hypothetical protein
MPVENVPERILRITDWDKHFECSQSRNLKRMAWVPIRIKLAGDGYTELLNHTNGAAHFGAWIGLVEVGATCEPRGTLLRGNGKPHDVESLSRITRIPVDILTEAIPRLLNIGWLEHETVASQQEDGAMLQNTVAPQRKFIATGHNITVQDKEPCASDDARVSDSLLSIDQPPFETAAPNAQFPVEPKKPGQSIDGLTPQQDVWFAVWWADYWLRKSRKAARQAFAKQVKSVGRFEQVMAATQAQTAEMLTREPQHRPHGSTWLRQERWEDEAAVAVELLRTPKPAYFDPRSITG